MNIRKYVDDQLNGYYSMSQQKDLLSSEIDRLNERTATEVIEAMNYAHGDGEGQTPGHISDKTAHIALHYKEEVERENQETVAKIFDTLLPVKLKYSRLDWCVKRLPQMQSDIIRDHFKHKITWKELEGKYSMSDHTLRNHYRRGVDALVEMYEVLAKAGVKLE